MGFFDKLQSKLDWIMVQLNKPSLDAKANFFRLLAVSQKAGLWVRDSLKSLQQWEKSKWMLLIINDMIDKLTEWASLAEAMEPQSYFFNSDEIELIRSTEITWNMVQTLEEIADTIISSGHTRLPVYRDSVDNVIGIINAKDIFYEDIMIFLLKCLLFAKKCVIIVPCG